MAQTRIGDVGRLASFPSSKVTKWFVLIFWLAVLAAAFGPAGKLQGALNNEAVAWLPADAQSTQVVKQIEAFQSKNEFPAVIVYERPAGLTAADLQSVTSQVAKFNALAPVRKDSVGPIPSKDGKALQVIVPIDAGSAGWDSLSATAKDLRAIAQTRPPGLSMQVTGPVGFSADSSAAFSGIDGKLLYSALTVVIVILLLTYRSPILWLIPVVSAGTALFVAQAVIYFLAKDNTLTVNAQSSGILTVIVFGAGTDYALLLVARYREELRRHEDRHEAMAFALHRAGPAIFASGATVIAGMLCLLVATMNSTKGLGPVAAIGVAVGLLVMLTLLPALLVVCGRWIFWPVRPSYGSVDHTRDGVWARIGARIARAPRRVWVVTSVLLAVAALGVLQLNAVGLQNKDAFYGTPESVVGEQVLARHFSAGSGSPVMVLANASQAGAVKTTLQGVAGVSSVADPVTKGDRSLIQATLAAAPDSDAATRTVDRIRTAIAAVPGARAIAGGDTATRADTLRASADDNKRIIPLILGVVLLILVLLLRAITAPLILMATVVLSYGAALGLSALIFRHVLGFAGADSSLPLFVFVFLVALGIDYNIFLMTRVHEETKEIGTRRGALVGLAATGGVITSAGLVLAGTFAVLGTLPVVAFAEIGLAVALGVLLDTLVVRSVLVTALNLDIRGRMWWPSALSKRDAELDAATPTASAETPDASALEPAH
ncbi:RND superfamily putative drug exporter [Phycicoccus badiiscoriae]|uniref:RND superfamily putative drug exporter n=1 Tax=Pedococcus badiiscoriae TaxID=642776 RepID=A0A852W9M2_9MICO|nr:MMPL family transporter [Pedococcus badiiscoriae]NYG05768.1 RND superfamily putative drug exporter [Pedococcus badiiscoriae]